MDIWRWIELAEFFVIAVYLLRAAHREKHLTQGLLVGIMASLLTDIVLHLLHIQKTTTIWILLNIAFGWYVYEKILRKYCIALYRRVMLALLELADS